MILVSFFFPQKSDYNNYKLYNHIHKKKQGNISYPKIKFFFGRNVATIHLALTVNNVNQDIER